MNLVNFLTLGPLSTVQFDIWDVSVHHHVHELQNVIKNGPFFVHPVYVFFLFFTYVDTLDK